MTQKIPLDGLILSAIDNSKKESRLGYIYIKGLAGKGNKVEVVYKIEKNLKTITYLKIIVENRKVERGNKGKFKRELIVDILNKDKQKQLQITNQIENTLRVDITRKLSHIEQVLIKFLNHSIDLKGRNAPKIEVLITSNLLLGVEEIEKIEKGVNDFFKQKSFRLPQ